MIKRKKYKRLIKIALIVVLLNAMLSISGCVGGGGTGNNENPYHDEHYEINAGEITYKIINEDTFIKLENGKSTVLARNVEKVLLKPLGSSDFEDCEGVEIKILLKNGSDQETVQTTTYFRTTGK